MEVLGNVDGRLTRVEQMLPALATREELRAAVAPLATRAEMRAEGENSRRYTLILNEEVRGDIRRLADRLTFSQELNAREHEEFRALFTDHEARLTRLEARRRR